MRYEYEAKFFKQFLSPLNTLLFLAISNLTHNLNLINYIGYDTSGRVLHIPPHPAEFWKGAKSCRATCERNITLFIAKNLNPITKQKAFIYLSFCFHPTIYHLILA